MPETLPAPGRRHFLAAAGWLLATPSLSTLSKAAARESQPAWIVHATDPPNREVPLPELVRSWITPVDRFYVRSHAASPAIDPATYRLTVDGLVDRPRSLSLDDLAGLERVEATATMTCAGNRRYEHSRTRTIKGVPWQEGAIGNAVWAGYRLSDLLRLVGVQAEARHVWFDGLDRIERPGGTIGFGASIPLVKAMADLSDGRPGAIVCTHQNGQPLTPDHGFPVRTVVPGYIGARSVKWLGRIRLANRENPNHYQATAYKLVQEASAMEWAEQPAIYRFPLNSVICETKSGGATTGDPESGDPESGEAESGEAARQPGAGETIDVSGYALPPGDPRVTIARVEVSGDGGNSWQMAELVGPSQPLCWQLWRVSVTLPGDAASLVVRAIDSRGQTQPQAAPWNKKGYLYNGWHRVPFPPAAVGRSGSRSGGG